MRRLNTRPVPMEMGRKIIDVGPRVASDQNTWPWHFVVVTETEGKLKLGRWHQEGFNKTFSAELPPVKSRERARRAPGARECGR